MADEEQLAILRQGVEVWNEWREDHPEIKIDLAGADLTRADLAAANLRNANLQKAVLIEAHLIEADLRQTNLSNAFLMGAYLGEAKLEAAKLGNARMRDVILWKASLMDGDLTGSDLSAAQLSKADFSRANLSGANMQRALLTETNLTNTDLTGARVYGISVWNANLAGAIQRDIIITRDDEPAITVDNLEVAQFIYLLLNNEKIRQVIDTITSKVVLILGRFTDERKEVLDAMRDRLRQWNYSPVMFDFEKPRDRNLTETVKTLALLSRFVIVDLTAARSVQQEMQATIPMVKVPFIPVIRDGRNPWGMFEDYDDDHWVLEEHYYKDKDDLLLALESELIPAALAKIEEIREIRERKHRKRQQRKQRT